MEQKPEKLRYWEEKPKRLKDKIKQIFYIIFQTPIYIILFILILFLIFKFFGQYSGEIRIHTAENYCKDYPGDKNECIEANTPSASQSDSYPDW